MKSIIFSIILFLFSKAALTQPGKSLMINFDFDKSELTTNAKARLDSFMIKFISVPGSLVQVNGYCDSKGTNAYNRNLSMLRANAVKNYLEKSNFKNSAVIDVKGFGENKLLNNDLTDEESLQNRRVEIILVLQVPEEDHDQASVSSQGSAITTIRENKSLTTILEDTALKPGSVLSLQNLEFENNSDILLRKSIPTLDELYTVLINNPSMNIAIEGHICCVVQVPGVAPEQSPNFYVSIIRAKKVWAFLIQKGIEAARLSYKGFGSSKPIYPIPEKSEEERIANRRVEIRIVKK